LVLWPRRQVTDAELSAHLNRFSSIAIWAIPLLFAGGIWLSLKLAGPVDTLFATDYGRWLILKLVFAIAALSIGLLNKFWVSRKIETGGLTGRKWLRRLLVIDAILFAAILTAIAAATTLTGPEA
jgi:putative copper export protein